MTEQLGAILAVCVIGGVLASIIAYSKTQSGGAAVGFFIFGMLFPLIGIIVACFVKPPLQPPMPPSWRPDPWDSRFIRWYDGREWTYHVQPIAQPYR